MRVNHSQLVAWGHLMAGLVVVAHLLVEPLAVRLLAVRLLAVRLLAVLLLEEALEAVRLHHHLLTPLSRWRIGCTLASTRAQ